MNGALLDELPLVTGLAPWLQTNLRAEPCEEHYAPDASPSGAGGCAHHTGGLARLVRFDLAEDTGEHVRLDWKGEEQPSDMHHRGAAAAPRCFRTVFFFFFFRRQAHQSLGTGEPDQPPQAGHT